MVRAWYQNDDDDDGELDECGTRKLLGIRELEKLGIIYFQVRIPFLYTHVVKPGKIAHFLFSKGTMLNSVRVSDTCKNEFINIF